MPFYRWVQGTARAFPHSAFKTDRFSIPPLHSAHGRVRSVGARRCRGEVPSQLRRVVNRVARSAERPNVTKPGTETQTVQCDSVKTNTPRADPPHNLRLLGDRLTLKEVSGAPPTPPCWGDGGPIRPLCQGRKLRGAGGDANSCGPQTLFPSLSLRCRLLTQVS